MKIKNPLIKNNKQVKAPKSINNKFALIAGLATMFVAPPAIGIATNFQVLDPDVVSVKNMTTIADTLDADTTYLGFDMRFIAPNNKSIKVNVDINDISEDKKQSIVDAIDTMSTIMDEINPKYKFEINFNPTKSDMDKLYSINVVRSDLSGTTLGTAHNDIIFPTIKGTGVYKSTITLDDSAFNNATSETKFKNLFLHEFFHSISWVGDAYNIEGYTTPSIMQSASNNDIPITKNDLKILVSKLSDDKSPNVNIDKLYEKILPMDDINKKIEYVTSTINANYLNQYFKLEGDEKINSPVQFDNLEDMYAIGQETSRESTLNESTYKFNQSNIVHFMDYSKDNFNYSQFKYENEKSTLLSSTFTNVSVDDKNYLSYNQIPAKWGNNMLIITVTPLQQDNYNLFITKGEIVSKEKYDEVHNNLESRAGTDYFTNKIYENIDKENLTKINKDSMLVLQNDGDLMVYHDGKLIVNDNNNYHATYKNGIIISSNNRIITKTKDNKYEMSNYSYDFINDEVNILNSIPLISLYQDKDLSM